jgi:putative ABC transport system permease protein/lipoprotein-releasing system permease protein
MDPQAFALDIGDPMAISYTGPVPIAILVIAFGTIWLRFRKFDPVAVVERRIV